MVSDWFPPKVGGVATTVYELSSELSSRDGIELDVITVNYCNKLTFNEKLERMNEFRVRRLPGVIFPYFGSPLYFHPKLPVKLRDLFLEEDYDVIHTHNLFTPISLTATAVAKRYLPHEKCVVTTNHTYREWVKPPISNILGRFTIRISNPDRVLVSSEASREMLEKMNADPDKIRKTPFGANTEELNPDKKSEKLREELGIESATFILFTGRLSKEKGLQYLLPAFKEAKKEYREMKLVILGVGPMSKKIKKFRKKENMEKSIKLVGQKSYDELRKYYATCDFVVAPSIKNESFGLVIPEAMASGKPIIVTKIRGFKESFQDNTGFLVPPKDIESLAEKILELAKNRQLREEMARRGRILAVEKYSWKNTADLTLEVYNEVLS